MRRFFPLALALTATSLEAQSIFDVGARVAPQFIQYRLGTPSSATISEFALPIFVLVPATPALSFDLGSAYTSARVEEAAGKTKTTSAISGLTDTQIRVHYTIGTDFVVLTGGVNLPTGRSTVRSGEVLAAGLIGSDFLAFPISNMGTGFGGTGGIAVARPLGDWNLGLGASLRHSAQYDPLEQSGSQAVHYQPGNEYRLRMGGD